MNKTFPQLRPMMVALLATTSLHGQATIYEGFDYDSGFGVVGQGGAADGWGAAWVLSVRVKNA